MVDITSHIKLIDFQTTKRTTPKTEKRQETESPAESSSAKAAEAALYDRVVLQFPKGRASGDMEEVPTREEANYALESLICDLANNRQDLGRIHEFADRRRVLTLLSPLVE